MITDREILSAQVTAAEIEILTDGAVESGRLRSWIARGLFPFTLKAPSPGMPRLYPMMATYTAAWFAQFERYGVTLRHAKSWVRLWMKEIAAEPDRLKQPVFVIFHGKTGSDAMFLTLEEGKRPLSEVLKENGGEMAVVAMMTVRMEIDRRFRELIETGDIELRVTNSVTK